MEGVQYSADDVLESCRWCPQDVGETAKTFALFAVKFEDLLWGAAGLILSIYRMVENIDHMPEELHLKQEVNLEGTLILRNGKWATFLAPG
jgi:hypothetical protein